MVNSAETGGKTQRRGQRRLTRELVVKVVGRIDDAKIAAILATGATLEELEEAVAWASRESDVMGDIARPLTGAAASVYDILTLDEQFEEDL